MKISYNINCLSYEQDKYYKLWTFKKNPNNVINDLYKLCFQNYRASLIIISSYKKERLKLHRSLLGVKGYGGGGGGNSPLSNI